MRKANLVFILSVLLVGLFFASSVMAQAPVMDTTSRLAQRDLLCNNFNDSVKLMLDNRAALGLSASQVKEIRQLSSKVQKQVVGMDAKIKALRVDINTTSWEAPLDLDQSNALLAEAHGIFEQRGKFLMKSLHQLHRILTPKQLKEFNNLI